MTALRTNPYTRLRDEMISVARRWVFRKPYLLFDWSPPKGEQVIPYAELRHAVAAAERCGMRCTIETRDDGGLRVWARECVFISELPEIYDRLEVK